MRTAMLLSIALCLAPAGCAKAQASSTAPIRVEGATAMLLASGTGVFYGRIFNASDSPDRLRSAAVPQAAFAQLHETVNDAEVSSMRAAPTGFPVAAHATLKLAHGGKHLMFFGVKNPDKVSALHVLLSFDRAGVVAIDAPITHGIAQ